MAIASVESALGDKEKPEDDSSVLMTDTEDSGSEDCYQLEANDIFDND